jgi:glycosyltransferase involved in cell wall biosynthesis
MIENVPLGRDHRLKKHAAALVEAGVDVTVICPRDPSNAKVPDVRVLDYKPPREGSSKWGFVWEYAYSLAVAAFLLARVFVTRGFDVIQMSSTPDIYFVVTAPFRLLGKKVVFDWKDPSPELYEARYGGRGLVHRTLQRLERASFAVAHHTFVVNESLRDFAMTRGGVKEEDVTIVGNGPVLARTQPRPARADLFRGRRHLVCLLGMMGPQDKVDLAIEAIDHLVHQLGRKDTAFAFVGVGDFVPEAKAMVGQRGLEEWVTFPGWVEEDFAFTYLSTADVGIEPNLEEFVSPVKAMEYMAFGLPFVAFDVAETHRLADGAGVYAKPGDVVDFARLLDDLLNDSDKRQQMGEIGKHRVQNAIAWDHQKMAYLEVYSQLLDRRSR